MKKSRKIRLRRIAKKATARREARETEFLTGIFHGMAAGYAFFTPDNAVEKSEDIFIPAKFTGNAIDGDTVKIKLLPPRQNHPEDAARGPVGKVFSVLSRHKESFVAELLPGSFVSPLNPKLPDVISIHGSRRGAGKGDWVKISCDNGRDGEFTGRITEVIGKSGSIAGDLDAVMAEFDLPGKYSDDDEKESASIEAAEISRHDCRELFVLTIDPFDAKDFDDALSVVDNGDGSCILGIHIADVAAYIRPGSKFDKAAKRRSFSCYLPGRTLPMLPAALTAKISMQQDQDSLAHSVFLTVDCDGKVISGKREHTLVKVAKRLNYDEVQNFIVHGQINEQWDDKIISTLRLLISTVRKMRAYRAKTEDFIDLPLPEVRVICDEENDRVIGIEKRLPRESEQIVEECMLAANQFVGRELPQKSVAGIYRIHPEPEAEKTAEFSDTMHDAFGIACGDISNRKYCREFIASLPDDEKKNLILGMLLRSLSRASYDVKGDIHFALGKTFYAHFTSPIRRYTDLTVHQQLWNLDLNQRTRPASSLEMIAAYASEVEEKIDEACFTANDRLKIRMVKEHIDNNPGIEFECIIVRILNSGVQIELPEFAVYGFVSARDLRIPLSAMRIGSSLKVRAYKINF